MYYCLYHNIHENRHSSDGKELIQSTLDKTCSLLGQLYRLSDYETEIAWMIILIKLILGGPRGRAVKSAVS